MSLEGKVKDDDLKHILDDAIKETTLNIHTQAIDNIIQDGHVDTGELIKTSNFEFKDGNGYVYFDAAHACIVGGLIGAQTRHNKRVCVVKEKDEILTKDGEYHNIKKVIKDLSVMTKPICVQFKPEKSYLKKGLTLTTDHLVLTMKNDYLCWEEIGKLAKGDIVFNLRKKAYNKGNSDRIKKYCVVCGNEFEVQKSKKEQRHCSKKCSFKYMKFDRAKGKTWKLTEEQRLKKCGKNNPSWKGGMSKEPYGIEWNRLLKEKVKCRDNYICQECGLSEVNSNYSFHVHHVDGNKLNNDIDNLTTLCPSCHGKQQWKDAELVTIDLERFKPVKIIEYDKFNYLDRLKKTKKRPEYAARKTLLYDFSVDGENSFVVGGIVIHNSSTEYGTEPHYVPIEDLTRWSRRKLGLSNKRARDVAYAIQHKIARYGTKPMRYLRNAIDSETTKN